MRHTLSFILLLMWSGHTLAQIVIDSVAHSVDGSNFYWDVTISNVPTGTGLEFKISTPAPIAAFGNGPREAIYYTFETTGGVTGPSSAGTESTPALDRWFDGSGIDANVASGGPGVWRIFGSRPHGTDPFVPGDTVYDTAIRNASFVVTNQLNSTVTSVAEVSYTVGGTISGLTGSVTLQNNGGSDVVKSADGGFVFPAQTAGTNYAVSVFSQPTGQTCTVTNGIGTDISANISNVGVACSDNPATAITSYTGELPSGATGTLSFTTVDAGCTFATPPQFLDTVSPAPPASVFLVDGVLSFSITGCTPGATVTLSMDYGSALPHGGNYWKAGTPWYRLPASISGSVITFSITDGGAGDTDGVANGTIVDPGGVAVGTVTVTGTSSSAAPIPSLSQWALIMLGLMVAGIGITRMRVRARG